MALRIPLAVDIGSRDSTLDKDALLTNCYAEKSQSGWDVYKRPGTDAYVTYLGPGQGTYFWNGALYSVFNDSMRNYSTSALYALSTDAYTGQQYQFAQTAGQGGTTSSAGAAWTQQTAAAGWSARQGAAGCVFDGKMWIMGGSASGTLKNDVWYSTDGITWTQATAAAAWAARLGATVVSYQNQMWLMGGQITGADWENDVYRSTDGVTWTLVDADADWLKREGHRCLVFNNRMWVIGGRGAASYNDVWWSTDGTTWTQATAAAAFAARWWHCAVVYQGQMWVYGGDNGGATYYNDVFSSTDGATWTQATASAAWSARSLAMGVTYGGRMWIAGGWAGGANFGEVYYSTDGITWTSAGTVSSGAVDVTRGTGYSFDNRMWRAAGNDGSVHEDEVWNSDLDSTTAATGPSAYLMVKNNNQAWYLTGTTLTQISDTDYPIQTVPGVINLDGTFYVMNRSGVISGSDIEDPSTWNSLNFIGSEAEPDLGVAITKILNYAVALGQWSIEAFQDVNNQSGSLLARIDGAYRQYGCASAGSVAYIENGIVFISQSRLRGREVVRMQGLEIEKISKPSVEKVILADALSTVHAFCFKAGGHEFYVLTLVASAVTLVCDLATKSWYRWTSLIAGTAQTLTSVTSTGAIASATLTSHGYSDGQVVLIAGATPTGYNGTFIVTRVSANVFSYPVASGLTSPATGTITATGYTDGYFRYINYVDNNGTDIVQHVTDGKLYQIGTTYTNDDDIRINTRARTGSFDGQTLDNKSFFGLRLEADTVSANAYIRWTDDDYASFTIFRRLSLNNPRKELRSLTRSRRRAFEVMHADDSSFIASSLEPIVKAWRI